MVGDGTEIVGENVFFFRRLHEAGVPVHLDQALSWSSGHVHQRVLTNADPGHARVEEQRADLSTSPETHRPSVKVSFDGLL
jgi:hypothetical protein